MSKDNVLRIKLCSVRTSIFVTTAEMFPVSFGSGRSKWQDAFMCQSQKIFQNLRLLHSNKIKTEGSSYKFWFFCKNFVRIPGWEKKTKNTDAIYYSREECWFSFICGMYTWEGIWFGAGFTIREEGVKQSLWCRDAPLSVKCQHFLERKRDRHCKASTLQGRL